MKSSQQFEHERQKPYIQLKFCGKKPIIIHMNKLVYWLLLFSPLWVWSQFVPFAMWQQQGPEISINDISVNEASDLIFTISINQSIGSDLSVNWQTVNDSALAGVDYNTNSGVATITSGNTSTTVTVTTINNATVCQSDRELFVDLSNSTKGVIKKDRGIGVIVDNDRPTLNLTAGSDVTEGQVTTAVAELSEVCATHAVGFQAITQNGTAIGGQDFQALSSAPFTIAAGNLTVNIPITTLDDNTDEFDENFNLVSII